MQFKNLILAAFAAISLCTSCSETKKTNSSSIQDAAEPTGNAVPTTLSNESRAAIEDNTAPKSIYDFKLTDIDGKPFSLKNFAGKKILIVNTASKCGYTKQYDDLEALYKKYSDKLVVVGFPSGNFMEQEFDGNEEIKEYCKKNHGVTFPLSTKVNVTGREAIPLFQWLVNPKQNGGINATIAWNFTKFLIDEKGSLLAFYPSKVNPLDNEIVSKL
jgi:glutathione peroxidase